MIHQEDLGLGLGTIAETYVIRMSATSSLRVLYSRDDEGNEVRAMAPTTLTIGTQPNPASAPAYRFAERTAVGRLCACASDVLQDASHELGSPDLHVAIELNVPGALLAALGDPVLVFGAGDSPKLAVRAWVMRWVSSGTGLELVRASNWAIEDRPTEEISAAQVHYLLPGLVRRALEGLAVGLPEAPRRIAV